MKHFSFLALLLCVIFSSCFKNGPDSPSSLYGYSFWAGNYDTRQENNDTGMSEDYTACISLQFNENASDCTVETGIVGLIATNRTRYSVKWYSNKTFTLYDEQGGRTIQYYSGTVVSSSTMDFEFLSCDKVEKTVELRWMNQESIE